MEKQEALKTLGVKEGASRIEIEKRYATILRRYRATGEDDKFSRDDFDEITEAYNLLMGYNYDRGGEDEHVKPSPLLKKLGVDEDRQDKLRNNLYYFRVHIIVGIIALIIIISSIRGCINRVDPDLYLVFLGEIYCSETEQLEEDIKSRIPEIEAVGIENLLISEAQEQQDPQVQMAMLQKAGVLMAAGDVDVFILDRDNYKKFVRQGAFMKLDELVLQLGLQGDEVYQGKIESEDRDGIISIEDEGIYGVEVKNSKILQDANTVGREMVVAISVRSKNYDKAVSFIKQLVETLDNEETKNDESGNGV